MHPCHTHTHTRAHEQAHSITKSFAASRTQGSDPAVADGFPDPQPPLPSPDPHPCDRLLLHQPAPYSFFLFSNVHKCMLILLPPPISPCMRVKVCMHIHTHRHTTDGQPVSSTVASCLAMQTNNDPRINDELNALLACLLDANTKWVLTDDRIPTTCQSVYYAQ